MAPVEKQTSPVLLIVAWLIVGLPGAWGVEQTILKSLDLFRTPVQAVPAPSSQPVK